MAAKLDWTLQKLQLYALFSSALLLVLSMFGYVGYMAESTQQILWVPAVLILPGYFFVILVFYLRLGLWPPYDFASLSAAWLWRTWARAVNKIYLNSTKRREKRSDLYRQLDSSNKEIRLVTILPGEGCATLKCTLGNAFLETNCSTYEALSYTWGSNYSIRSIEVNSKPLHVTKNLEVALRRLRLPYTSRQLWIDAICINQEDDIERSEQVQLMRKIYTQAKQVIIWLGEASTSSDIAMDFFRLGSSQPDMKEWFKTTVVKTTRGNYTREWESVFRFQNKEYWRRTWIVQELMCATEIELFCGSRCVSWTAFISCISAWYEVAHNTSDDVIRQSMAYIQTTQLHVMVTEVLAGTYLDLWTVPRLRPLQFERDRLAQRESPSSRTLSDFMFNHQGSHATDERDKIYAFAGISSDCQLPSFPIDYSVPAWTVYMNVLVYLLENTGKLDMMAYCGIGKQYGGRPTWTPSFYWGELLGDAFHNSQQLFGNAGTHAFAASKTTQAKAKFTACPKPFDKILGLDRTILQAEGLCVDVISRRLLYSDKWGNWKIGINSNAQQEYQVTSSLWMTTLESRRLKLQMFKALFDFALKTPSASHVHEGRIATLMERKEEFFRTMICDRTAEGSRAPEEWSEAFAVLMLGPSRLPTVYATSSSMSPAPSRTECARAFVGPLLTAVENTFCGEFWLFLTERGRLGIANKNARVGDKICVVLGCNMPLVIRSVKTRQEENAIAATVHGSAYFHYYMDGRAIDEMSEGKLSLTTFVLK